MAKEISLKSMVPFCRQLAVAYRSGIPIVQTLEMLRKDARDRKLRGMLGGLVESVRGGETLQQALQNYRSILPPFFIEMVSAGEVGGKLEPIFSNLAQYFERRRQFQLELRKSTVPIVAEFAVIVVLVIFIATIQGALSGVFTGKAFDWGAFGTELTARYILAGLAVVAAIVLWNVAKSMGGIRHVVRSSAFLIPWVGRVPLKLALARFARSLSLLVSAGVPIKDAVARAAASTDVPAMRDDLMRAIPIISSGGAISAAFERSRFLTPMAKQMIFVGEEAGSLDETLAKVADLYEDEAAATLHVTKEFLRMAMIILMVAFGGYFVIRFWTAYYGNMFKQIDSVL